MNNLLQTKINRKKTMPNFARTDSNIFKQFKNWRKPRGMHNKLRRRVKGHIHIPALGYGSPSEVRHFTKDGLLPVLIKNIIELKNIDKHKESVLIAKTGLRKKMQIIEKCGELGLKIANVKDASKFIEEKKKFIEEKKKSKQEKNKKKEKSKQELEKKAKEKESKGIDKTDEKQKEVEEKIKEDMKKRLPGDKK